MLLGKPWITISEQYSVINMGNSILTKQNKTHVKKILLMKGSHNPQKQNTRNKLDSIHDFTLHSYLSCIYSLKEKCLCKGNCTRIIQLFLNYKTFKICDLLKKLEQVFKDNLRFKKLSEEQKIDFHNLLKFSSRCSYPKASWTKAKYLFPLALKQTTGRKLYSVNEQ